jgi:hypothetical protein
MVMRATSMLLAMATMVGCSLVNAGSSHTEGLDGDAGPDGALDANDMDAPLSPPSVRVVHLSRDTALVDVYANGAPIAAELDFATVSEPLEVPAGSLSFRVMRADTDEQLVTRDFVVAAGRQYTLTFFGDEVDPPVFVDEAARTVELLLLDDDATGLDTMRDIRLAVIHVASPVIAGQLVAVRPPADGGNLLLADDFGFQAVAPLRMLPSMSYRVGFDAEANGTVDVTFDLPKLVPGTYANVFVAARSDDSVFLLVDTDRGATEVIDAN